MLLLRWSTTFSACLYSTTEWHWDRMLFPVSTLYNKISHPSPLSFRTILSPSSSRLRNYSSPSPQRSRNPRPHPRSRASFHQLSASCFIPATRSKVRNISVPVVRYNCLRLLLFLKSQCIWRDWKAATTRYLLPHVQYKPMLPVSTCFCFLSITAEPLAVALKLIRLKKLPSL